MNVVTLRATLDQTYQRLRAAGEELETVEIFRAPRTTVAERLAASRRCCRAIASWTWRARWSASAASARAAG